jgi:multidrug efflux pump subunit AcrA (membrane-fusion protein)
MLPGQYARIRLQIGKQDNAILIPQSAVGYDQLGTYALIVDENNTVERRKVKTGVQQGYSQVIDEGLAGDEWVITIGLLKAAPGKQVAPERAQAQKSAGEKPVQGACK